MSAQKPKSIMPPPDDFLSVVLGNHQKATGDKPTLTSTERALVLRNGKYGSMGSGEIVHSKMSGNEKLVLLAEDAMERSMIERRSLWKGSFNMVRAPFNLQAATRISQSQMDNFIDLINGLHDPDLCYDIVEKELKSLAPPEPSGGPPPLLSNTVWVAEQFGTLVHNGYMLASAWAIVYDSLQLLEELGLSDRTTLLQLKSNERMRQIFLLSFGLVVKLVAIQQQRLRLIVQNTAYYKKYFKIDSESNAKNPTVEFDYSEVRKMHKSFLDSAIIELCLPGSKFSPQALYTCLNAIEEESPKELGRCPQAMWDAVGDLAETVRLYDLMETALIKEDGTTWDPHIPIKAYEYAKWEEAQGYSIAATLNFLPFLNLVNPTTNLKNKAVLASVWERINDNYILESGNNIDTLWQIQDKRDRKPHWTPFHLFLYRDNDPGLSDEERGGKQLVKSGRGSSKKKPLAITAGDEDSSDQVPGLLDVSDSDDGIYHFSSDEEEKEEEDDDDDFATEDEYDSEEEEELRRDYRAAMEIIAENPDLFDQSKSEDKYEKERKGNPFLSLLSNLRGRLFKNESILKTEGAPLPDKNRTGPVVEPEEEGTGEKKKKRKKKPKKKKKKAGVVTGTEGAEADAEDGDGDDGDSDEEELANALSAVAVKQETVAAPVEQVHPKSPVPTQSPVSTPKKKKKGSSGSIPPVLTDNAPSSKPPSISSPTSFYTNPFMSTTSLAVPPQEVKPSSGHSFFHSSGLAEKKQKVKTHREQPSEGGGGGSFFSRFLSGIRGKSKAKESELNKESEEGDLDLAIFRRLKRRPRRIACRLFGFTVEDRKGHLKWEDFVYLMIELGFNYEPGTAGSSVRFDPPGGEDRSISIHKPHPDATLEQYRLQDIRTKLVKFYGWNLDAIRKILEGYAAEPGDRRRRVNDFEYD